MVHEGRHRPIPRLIGDTFGVVGRCFREVAVIAIVAAAVAVVSVAMFTTAMDAVTEEIFENPTFEALMDVFADDETESEQVEAAFEEFADSVDGGRLVTAGWLFVGGMVVSLLAWSTTIAVSLVARGDAEGLPVVASRALGIGLARLPKALLLAVIYVVAAAAAMVVLGLVVVVASLVHAVLGVLAGIAAVGAFLGTLALLVPLAQMHFVMAYVESGFPSFGRWWRLVAEHKAATWGRAMLIFVANIAVVSVLGVGLLALPSPYGDFISNAIAGPVIAALSAIAYVLMYTDLSGRRQPPHEGWPE